MILVRHARSEVLASVPAAEWVLSEDGRAAAADLGRRLATPSGVRVMASTEPKAIDTATAFSLGPVTTSETFCEVERPWYDDGEGLARDAQRWFAGEAVAGWDSLAGAIERFGRGLEECGDSVVVVTHGTVMTAWLASIGATSDPFAFWQDLRMPDAWQVDVARREATRVPS